MTVNLKLEEVLILLLTFFAFATGFLGTPIALVLTGIEAGRSVWSLLDRWQGLLRARVVFGGALWAVTTVFIAIALGGIYGLIALAYLLAVGIIALAHLPEIPQPVADETR